MSGAEVEYAVHIIEVLVVVFAGLGFDHAPRCTEANEIETAGGHIAEQLVVDIEFVLVVLAVFALIYDIDAVEDTFSAVFIDKASFSVTIRSIMLSLTHQNLINNLYLVYIIYLNIANIARLLRKFGVLVNVCGFLWTMPHQAELYSFKIYKQYINLKVFIVKYAKKCYYKFTDISFFRRIRK